MIKWGTTQNDNNLITRCFNIRKTHHVSLMRYVFDERYANQCKKQIHSVPQNVVTDSVRTLLTIIINTRSKYLKCYILHSSGCVICAY